MTGAIAGVLFDKDGVFVDFEKTWTPALKAIAADAAGGDRSLETRLLDVAGFDPHGDTFLPGSIWAAGHTDDLVKVWMPLLNGMSPATLVEKVNTHCLKAASHPVFPVEEGFRIFSGLKQLGLALGVATNDAAASARATVSAFGLADMFDLVLGYDSVASPKPAGDPLLAFAGHTGLEPHRVIMVGDNAHDMQCGRAGGAGLCIGVLSGNSSREQLMPLADHVIEDISHLQDLLASLEHGAQVQR
ncbi:MAG: HAD family hydrolase [Pseudomonadota bacterium]